MLFPAGRRWGDDSQDATSVTVCLTPAFHPYLSLARARRGSRRGNIWAARGRGESEGGALIGVVAPRQVDPAALLELRIQRRKRK